MKFRQWKDHIIYFSALLGFLIGIGNLWRFPYLCFKNGGGAFFIPFVISHIVLGLPLMYLEFTLGQFRGVDCLKVYDCCPIFRGLGAAQILMSTIISYYYAIILAYFSLYLIEGMLKTPPWATCDNYYNTEKCYVLNNNKTISKSNAYTSSSTHEYMVFRVVSQDEGTDHLGPINYTVMLLLFLIWLVNSIFLSFDLQNIGIISIFLVGFPYIVLVSLGVTVFFMSGSMAGMEHFLKIDYADVFKLRAWTDAVSQTFYSLGISHASTLTFSSFSVFKSNNLKSIIYAVIINAITSIFTCITIFGLVGSISAKLGIELDNVLPEGINLTFIMYSELIRYSRSSKLWSLIFYGSVYSIGILSLTGLSQPIYLILTDFLISINVIRRIDQEVATRVLISIVFSILSIPLCCKNGLYIWESIDKGVVGLPLFLHAFLILLISCYIYGYDRLANDMEFMYGGKPNGFWRISWMYTCPIIVFILIGIEIYLEAYTDHCPKCMSYVFTITRHASFSIILIYMIYLFYANGGKCILKNLLKPDRKWGPAEAGDVAEYHKAYYYTNPDKIENLGNYSTKENIIKCLLATKARTGGPPIL